MKVSLSKVRLFALILSFCFVSFFGGWWLGHQDVVVNREKIVPQVTINRATPQDKQNVEFALFWSVWDRLENSYYDKTKLDTKEMVYGAIKGMVAAVGDPYTVFLPPTEQKRTQEDLGGQFEGVGIQIGFKGTQLAVIAPLDGSPAQKAGIKAGDFIVGIKDKEKNVEIGTVGMSLPDAVDLIRGKAGSAVTLVLTREGVDKPFEKELTRAKIEVPSVILTFEGPDKNIAHLKLLRFGDQTDNEWNNAIKKIKDQNGKGVILDLRNNPGGYLNGAVTIASEFMSSGVVVIESGKGNNKELKVTGNPKLPNIPLIVLVNKGSASASEIVAGAIKDSGRGQIVGDTTFGKGTIQESQEIGQAGLHITIAKWLTPKGTWVNGTGLEPDVKITQGDDSEKDNQLEKAIELLK
ncbi:MAG: hypothetical protein A3D24_01185 [Candidatus Blackburnbacteria bacterium RIFCSPHIGHO2_02_FULL_39_13]|uniref:PDZ domain-containing protein n=1 Tax=Candidatus Blackburnbacteria bacterium RIFCSPLOWO2_01_FULL_40_20 TaxID=1797519 RepID=A0A1G1VG26_9BACT|nr:MAG: Carboxyl-terminal protease [Microgenomates group bacterium GW2011_GWA2_39_19]OGY07313.1 MAG: hypothetical protein A2694_04365 [Candidatus Blackburnbacteria bacterium RIFCSPHIGHO2_01_FULL_40_17]OGY08073.1 MAG: hypothetical protein A3D24_01185 [Candidatus Blackburnbacteria bacterium RIFCSPHIGHO2_02_FULL_39_13]OGY14162.1 MAG: hypothetical protein A3A77_04865 [Candidatus Blackburnbacteria bacterium RIFCSPLOWO2_01_FULL_40_20]OGY15458.1 MAG: hypothetical protein A3I52_01990 [Candidatus Blackb